MKPESVPLSDLAVAALGNRRLAERWLTAPSPLYGGATPLDAAESLEGRDRVRRQLNWFSGRFDANIRTNDPVRFLGDLTTESILQNAGHGPEELLGRVWRRDRRRLRA